MNFRTAATVVFAFVSLSTAACAAPTGETAESAPAVEGSLQTTGAPQDQATVAGAQARTFPQQDPAFTTGPKDAPETVMGFDAFFGINDTTTYNEPLVPGVTR